jgi:hypothetical protein
MLKRERRPQVELIDFGADVTLTQFLHSDFLNMCDLEKGLSINDVTHILAI